MEHYGNGIPILRPDVPKEDDSFHSIAPKVPLSIDQQRLGHTVPPVIDHTPSLPVFQQAAEQAKLSGNNLLADLMRRAEVAAKEQARLLETERRRSTNEAPRGLRKSKEVYQTAAQKAAAPTVLFTEADVCSSDEEFLARTIDSNIQTIEMKRLFYANGGALLEAQGLLYAPAFDTLRREKATAIRIKTGQLKVNQAEEWKRFGSVPKESIVYQPEVPSVSLLLARQNAAGDARERLKSARWLSTPLSRRTRQDRG